MSIPDEILNQITEISIVNHYGELYQYTDETHKIFLRSLKARTKKAKLLHTLFNNSKINNLNEEQERVDYLHFLRNNYAQEQFIFFDILLTNMLVIYFIEGLLGDKTKILGYRYIEKEADGEWVIIKDVSKYLFIGYFLFIRFIKFFEANDKKITLPKLLVKGHQNALISLLEKSKFKKHLCYFKKSDQSELNKFIELVNEKFDYFKVYRCTSGVVNLPPKTDQLLILDFGKLSMLQQRNLLEELVNGEYKEKRVIIITDDEPDIAGLPQFTFWPGLSIHTLIDFLDGLVQLYMKINEQLTKQVNEYKYVIENIADSEKERNKLIKNLEEKFIADVAYDPYKVDFIYDAPEGVEVDENKMTRPLIEIAKKYFTLKHKTKFYISRDEKNWVIVIDEEEPITVSFKSRGLRYIIYLNKHYCNGEKIVFSKLLDVIVKWEKMDEIN